MGLADESRPGFGTGTNSSREATPNPGPPSNTDLHRQHTAQQYCGLIGNYEPHTEVPDIDIEWSQIWPVPREVG